MRVKPLLFFAIVASAAAFFMFRYGNPGIISIGDVLKHRLDELELEANVMRDYAVAARR